MKAIAALALIGWLIMIGQIIASPTHNAKGFHVTATAMMSFILAVWVLVE